MTQIGHFLCLLLGCLIGHLIVYIARGIWNFLTKKRVEIPEIKYDVADNPILSLKNRLGQAYVVSHDQTVKKLLHRLLEYVEVIEEWHNAKIHLAETKCDTYRTKAARTEVELATERSKNAELEKQLKEEREKNKIPLFTKPVEAPDFLIEKRFPGQTDPYIKITMDKEAVDKAIRLQTNAIRMGVDTATYCDWARDADGILRPSDIILDGKEIDEPKISNEEFVEKLRDWWGLEASKAVEIALPNTVKKKWPNDWVDAVEAARDPDKWPEYMAKVEGIPWNFKKYKVTLYDMKDNETTETELYGADIEDALTTIDSERYGVVGYRRLW